MILIINIIWQKMYGLTLNEGKVRERDRERDTEIDIHRQGDMEMSERKR